MTAPEEATGRVALAMGARFIRDALHELESGRGYDDRGVVEMHLTSALAFLRGVFPEAVPGSVVATYVDPDLTKWYRVEDPPRGGDSA
jgi:hypothetical protein